MKDISKHSLSVASRQSVAGKVVWSWSFQFEFTNRETYLEFVAAWKAAYAKQSDEIRATKKAIADANRKHFSTAELHYALVNAKIEANRLLAMRKAAKIEAQAQFARVTRVDNRPVKDKLVPVTA